MADSNKPTGTAVSRNTGSDQSGEQTNPVAALGKLAQKNPGVTETIQMMMGVGPIANPLHQKMTPEHITQVLEIAAKHDEREYNLQQSEIQSDTEESRSWRRYGFAAFVIVVVLTVVILYLFRDKPEILIPVLAGEGGLVSGFLAGFGVGRKDKRE